MTDMVTNSVKFPKPWWGSSTQVKEKEKLLTSKIHKRAGYKVQHYMCE